MYCPHCHILTVNTRCPICLSREGRQPKEDDYCFLTEKEKLWAPTVTDILGQNGIPFVTESVLGAGLSARMGSSFERVRIYVPYAHYDAALALERGFFSESYDRG